MTSFVDKVTGSNSMKDKVAVITGGTGGIGIACAEEILKRGGKVMLTDLKESDSVSELLKPLAEVYGKDRIAYAQADVTNAASLTQVMEKAAEMGGGQIHMLVNSAGVQIQSPVKVPAEGETQAAIGKHYHYNGVESFSKVIDINLKGSFNAIFAALPFMREGSAIVNMASVHAHVGSDQRAPYCASKFGLMGMTKALAADLAMMGVRINTVSPAFVKTDLATKAIKAMASQMSGIPVGQIEETSEEYKNAEELRLSKQGGQWITMDEVVQATADLLQGSGKYARKTGADVQLDNGLYVSQSNERDGGIAIFDDAVHKAIARVNAQVSLAGVLSPV